MSSRSSSLAIWPACSGVRARVSPSNSARIRRILSCNDVITPTRTWYHVDDGESRHLPLGPERWKNYGEEPRRYVARRSPSSAGRN